MNTAVQAKSAAAVDYINPVITAARNVFGTMLGCTANRTGVKLKENHSPEHDVSAVIGITGKVQGTLVFSVSKKAAIEILRLMIGLETEAVNAEVCDAVGELTNMIAGGAKAQLAQLQLSLSIPNVVCGAEHTIYFPSTIKPICVLFDSDIGPFTIEVGFTNLE